MKYLEFEEVFPFNKKKLKTKIFAVRNKDKCYLGFISWNCGWRQYCYDPTQNIQITMSSGCLREVSDFIDKLMSERKK